MVELSWARDQWLAKQREADRARCQYWNLRMSERGPAQPSPTIRQAVHCGFPFLRVTCRGCNQTQWVDLRDVKRRPDTPIWTMEGSLACDWCRTRSTFPPKDCHRAADARPWHPWLAEGLATSCVISTR
jgi:hypothetical protein